MQEVEQNEMKATAEDDEISFDDTFQMLTIVEIIHQKQKAASLIVHPVVLLSKFDVQENEENKQLQKLEQDKLKATAEDDEISFDDTSFDDTFQMETVVEIVHQKQKPASLTVHPAVLLSEFDVKGNEKNKQMQEVEQEKLKATAEYDEISFGDTFQMETDVEIVHQNQKSASLTVHPVVLLPEFDVKENEENKQMQQVEQKKLKATTEEVEMICD